MKSILEYLSAKISNIKNDMPNIEISVKNSIILNENDVKSSLEQLPREIYMKLKSVSIKEEGHTDVEETHIYIEDTAGNKKHLQFTVSDDGEIVYTNPYISKEIIDKHSLDTDFKLLFCYLIKVAYENK